MRTAKARGEDEKRAARAMYEEEKEKVLAMGK